MNTRSWKLPQSQTSEGAPSGHRLPGVCELPLSHSLSPVHCCFCGKLRKPARWLGALVFLDEPKRGPLHSGEPPALEITTRKQGQGTHSPLSPPSSELDSSPEPVTYISGLGWWRVGLEQMAHLWLCHELRNQHLKARSPLETSTDRYWVNKQTLLPGTWQGRAAHPH